MELKPCPFCGGEATALVDHTRHLVWCNNIDCTVMPASNSFASADAAAEKWNRRAESDLLAALKEAYKIATEHDEREPFDWGLYCEMLHAAIARHEHE